MSRALVVGQGSAGRRHARLLRQLGCDTAVVSRRRIDDPARFTELTEALSAHRPDYVVLAGATIDHAADLDRLVKEGFDGRVLMEKPLFVRPAPLPDNRFESFNLGYNLRFHPALIALRERLQGSKAIACQAHVGQYLPDWREDRNYRASYSAKRAEGGGVLRDLSHEIDSLLWLFGAVSRLTAAGGRLSKLEIDCEDAVSLLWQSENCPLVSLHMNYLDRPPQRRILVQGDSGTHHLDLIAGRMNERSFSVDGDDSYRAMHEDILGGGNEACTAQEGLRVMNVIMAAEKAMADGTWVTP